MSMEDFGIDFFGGIKPAKKKAKAKKNGNGNGKRVMMEEMEDFGIPAFNGRFGKVGEGFLEKVGGGRTGSIDFAEGGRGRGPVSPLFAQDVGIGGFGQQRSFGIKRGALERAAAKESRSVRSGRKRGKKRSKKRTEPKNGNGNGNGNGKEKVALGVVAGRGIRKGVSGLARRIKERRSRTSKNGTVTFASGQNGNGNGNGK